jgi:HEPN domain-containing protein
MQDDLSHARGWFLKADSDLAAAHRIVDGDGPYDTACFHAQQAAERLLKGLLAYAGQPIPPTHHLGDLQRLCTAAGLGPSIADLDLAELTPYAVRLRYELAFWPDRETAEESIALAEELRAAVLAAVPEAARP